MEDLKQILITLHRQYPNNLEFGEKVRHIVWQMMEHQSKLIQDEQLPGQIDMFDSSKNKPLNS